MSGKVWTEKELDYLCINAYKLTVKEISKELGRSIASIKEKMRKENLTKSNRWTESEIDYLKKWNGKKQDKEIAKDLGRTATAVKGKCGTMGLRGKYMEWLPEQDELLLECYDSYTCDELAGMVGHPSGSVRQRIKKLTSAPKNIDISSNEKIFEWFDKDFTKIEKKTAFKIISNISEKNNTPKEILEDKYNTWRNDYMHTKFI